MHELIGRSADNHSIRIGLALDAGGNVRRLTECELFVSTWTTNFADHDWAGVNADANLQFLPIFNTAKSPRAARDPLYHLWPVAGQRGLKVPSFVKGGTGRILSVVSCKG